MRSWPVAVLLAALATVGVSYAQDQVTGALEQSATTTPREKAELADRWAEEIATAVKTVEGMLRDALQDKEQRADQIECIERKLAPLTALSEVARRSGTAMKQALGSNDAIHAEQEFRKVAVARTKAAELLTEAQACVEDGLERGDSTATLTDNSDSFIGEEDMPPIDEFAGTSFGTGF